MKVSHANDWSCWELELNRLGLRKRASLYCHGEPISAWRVVDAKDPTLFTAKTCSSSMDLLRWLVEADLAPVWSSVLVGAQWSGRGQFGRLWHSPPGNVYGSLRLPSLDETWQNLASLLVAAGTLGSLLDLKLDARVKWPNDILVGSKKVCGILIEERLDVIIAGVGLNLASAPGPDLMRDDYVASPGRLADFGIKLSPPEMWLQLVRRIQEVITRTITELSREEFTENLEPLIAYMGESVIVDAGNNKGRGGTLLGLEPNGGIKVRTSTGDEVFHSRGLRPLFRNQ